MRRFTGLILAVALLLASAFGCKWSNKSSSNTGPSPEQSAATPTPDYSLDAEAATAVKEFWEAHYTRCGESYYGLEDNYPFVILHQYKGISFMARGAGPASEADKLNGILWNGKVRIFTGPYRERPQGREWSNWKQSQNLVEEVSATKRESGGWSVTQVRHITVVKKVNCSEVE